MSDIAIWAEGLSKQYHIGGPQKQYSRLGDRLMDTMAAPIRRAGKLLRGQATGAADLDEKIWALQKVSFEIKRGEVVGIIGRNGSGKSTLLKILSRITEPTEGNATINGRVGSLLEVGTGFHPELTGRENIFLNGAILGMRKGEIERKFDEIVAFAEIGKFIDTPVKHYSSGMYVRLAFSVAAHLEPDILLVDEVLAVGDVAFQRKCLGKMDDVAQQGRTVLFVSHNMTLIQTLCQRGILLQDGAVTLDDTVSEAVDGYLQSLEQLEIPELRERTDRVGEGRVKLVGLEIAGCNGNDSSVLRTGGPAQFAFYIDGLMPGVSCRFFIFNHLGQQLVTFKSNILGSEDVFESGIGSKFICEIDELLLMPGRYRVNASIIGGGVQQDFMEAAAFFNVQEGQINGRFIEPAKNVSIYMPHRWTLPLEARG